VEKNSCLMPIQKASLRELPSRHEATVLHEKAFLENAPQGISSPLLEGASVLRLPTRLLASPIELRAPIRKNELWVLQERAFVVGSIQFDQRLEAVEWWDSERVFRDYFRIWLAAVEGRQMGRDYSEKHGLEALVYLNREDGKSYIQALYD
jgi:hypothetical protein